MKPNLRWATLRINPFLLKSFATSGFISNGVSEFRPAAYPYLAYLSSDSIENVEMKFKLNIFPKQLMIFYGNDFNPICNIVTVCYAPTDLWVTGTCSHHSVPSNKYKLSSHSVTDFWFSLYRVSPGLWQGTSVYWKVSLLKILE